MSKRFNSKRKKEFIEYKFERERRENLLAKEGKNDFVLVLDNLKGGFNIAKIFRSADAFSCRRVYIVGTKLFDTVAGKGSFKHVPATFCDTFKHAYDELKSDGYTFYIMDSNADNNLSTIKFDKKAAFIIGHEEFGPSEEVCAYEDFEKIKINQYGKVESLNVSVASSIVMYEYLRQKL